MTSSATEKEGFRHRVRQRLNRFRDKSRDKSRDSSNNSTIHPQKHTQADPSPATNATSTSQNAAVTASSLPLNQARGIPPSASTNAEKGKAQIKTDKGTPLTTDQLALDDNDAGGVTVSSDLWSAAYREAVENLGEEIDIASLKRKNVAQLFSELEEIDQELTHESAFVKGMEYLRSLQVPLERFKLALDLASPLTSIEPNVSTAFGAVRSVTVMAISLASADLDFAKQIAEMLQQISYIDDCDTLGQKSDKKDIHKALVLVYQKILEFYEAAFEILTKRGAKLIMKMVLENGRLPNIVQDFLKYSENLQKLVQKATWEIMEDVKAMLYDHEIARWLGGDKMKHQSKYHADQQELRADRACEFLLESPNFINWYHASDSQQLVVLGDMGSGKTIAMTFLIDELRRRNERQVPQPKICYYFCRDDETGKATSIFSGLILSLLEQLPGLQKPFFDWYKQAQTSGIFDPATNIKKLEEFLQKVLEAIDRPVFVVIDGLDECDTASRNCLLKLLKTLSQKITGLKTVLSSRPQEEILELLDGTARMEMGSDAERDGIIVEKAVERQLFYLSADVKTLVIERLSHSAQGSAIWTKMVVKLIELRKIRAFNPMRSFLEEMPLPEKLSELYATLLSRCASDDPENMKLASTALKLLAVNYRPLSILELAWAVTLGTAQHVTTMGALAKLVDHQRVMSLIHPFIARVDFSDVRKRQIRLIHQSVKEFIIKEWTSKGPASTTETDLMIFDPRFESLEAFILDICIRYLLLDDIGNRNLFSEEQAAIIELPQEFDLFNDNEEPPEYDPYCTWERWEEDMILYDPTERGFGEFFVYASSHWIEHFGNVTVEPLPSLASIENLCRPGSTRFSNWTEQNRRPGCAIQPRFDFETCLYDPLSITSLYGAEAILRDMLKNSNFDDGDKFLRNPAMGAADQILQWGDVSRLKILFFDDKLGHQLQNFDFFRLLIKMWGHPNTTNQKRDPPFELVDYVSDKLVQEQWGNELLCVAASAGCIPMIRRLMTNAQQKAELRSELLREFRLEQKPSRFGKPPHQSIGEGVLEDHVDVVEYLLGEDGIEAHLRYRNSRGENVLHLASKLCNPDMFRLLIPRFQEGIHQVDDQGNTALFRIIAKSSASPQDRYETAEILLLQSGADWDSHSSDGPQNPLRAAVQFGDLDMCSLLIRTGKMDPLLALTRDSEGQMDLKDRSPQNKDNRSQILELLCTHAKIETSTSAQS